MSSIELERNYGDSYGSSTYDNNETNYKTQPNINNNQISQGQSQYNPNLENPQMSNRYNEKGISLIGTLNQNFGSSVGQNNQNIKVQNSQTQSFYNSQRNFKNNNNTKNENLTVTVKKSTKKTKKIRETRNQSPPRMSEIGENSQENDEEYTSERKMNKMMKMIKNAHIEKIKNFIYLKEINHAYDEMIRLKQEGDLAASKDMERELNKLTETVVQLNLDAFAKTQLAKSHANSFFGNSSISNKYKGEKSINKTAREKKVKSIFDSTIIKTKILNRNRNLRENSSDKDNYEEMIEEEEEEEEKTKIEKRNKNKVKSQKDGRENNDENKKSDQGNYNNQNNNLRKNNNSPNNIGNNSSYPNNNYSNNYNNIPNNNNNNYNNNAFEKSHNQNSYNDYPNQDYANSNYNLNDPNPNNMVYGDQYQRGIIYQDNVMGNNQNLSSLRNPEAQSNIIQTFKNNLYQQSNANQKQDENNKNNNLKPSFFNQSQSGNNISISFGSRGADNNNNSHNNRIQEKQFAADRDARTDSSPHGTLSVDEEGNIINNKKNGKDILSNTLLTETVLLPNQSDNQSLIQKQNIEQTDLFTTSGQYVSLINQIPERENPNDPNQSSGIGPYSGSNERGNPLYPNSGQKIFPPNSQSPGAGPYAGPNERGNPLYLNNGQKIFPPNSQNPNLERQEYPRNQKSQLSQQNDQNPRLINPIIQKDPYNYPNQGGEGAYPHQMPYINPNLPPNQRYPRQINPNTGLPYDRQGRPYQSQPQYFNNIPDNSSPYLRNKKGINRRPKSNSRSLMIDRYYNAPNDNNPNTNNSLYKFRDRFRASLSRSKSRSNSKNRTKFPADIPFSYSTQGKCFACNVECNISRSGNSSNNFIPYKASFKMKRNDKTYYDEDKYGY